MTPIGWIGAGLLALANALAKKKDWLATLLDKDSDDLLVVLVRAVVILVVGLGGGRLLAALVGRLLTRRFSAQQVMITRRFVFYAVLGVTNLALLENFGVELSVLLGAAGILTVALGFASQTSASNLISGLFLLGERPFVVGDVIQVGQRVGEVLSVDMLSVKLRTFDNLFVRVPNETLIKSEIVNITRNPIRRIDIDLRIAYDEDLDRVRELLHEIVAREPDILEEPEPTIWVDALGESAIQVRFLIWASNRGRVYYDVGSRVLEAIAREFRDQRISVGYPRVDVARGEHQLGAAASARASTNEN